MSDPQPALVNRLLELTLQEVSTHALVLLDPQGTVVAWLAGAERLFGYHPGEIIGQNISVLFTPEDFALDLSTTELRTAVQTGESEDDRWQVRKDGGRIWTSGTVTALRDQQDHLLGFVKIMRNRTDQKLQVETLESRITALQQGNQRRTAFAATLAHELRNPLSVLSNAVDLLKGYTSLPDDLTLVTGLMQRQIEFMRRMADDILEVARAATGKTRLDRQQIIFQELIQQAVETCQPALEERAQLLHQVLPEVPISLNGDPIRLRQILVNLITNASKYTDPGGTIWIKATVEGDEAVIRVQDTGIGIAPEVMPHIFDLFAQAETDSYSRGGLGIGLSVVKDNVALHGGSVQVTSDGLGKGSEFTVRLPMPAPVHGPASDAGP